MIKKILFISSLLFVFIGCSSNNNSAGGAEDVNTFTVAGVIQLTDGSKAEGCSVILLPVDYTPNGTELDDAYITGKDGNYSVNGEKGSEYNLWAIKDSLSFIALHLSSDSDHVDRIDTVKEVGSVKVTLPDDFTKNSVLSVYIQGTGIYKVVEQEDLINDNGIVSVILPGIAPQEYDNIICQGDITGDTLLNEGLIRINSAELVDDALYAEWTDLTLHAELIGKNITALASDDKGNYYVGTDSAGLFLYRDSSWQKIDVSSISMIGIKDIEVLNDTVYIIVNEGIIKISGNSGINISQSSSVISPYVPSDLTVLSTGEVFVSLSIGIAKYDGANWKHLTTASSVNLSSILSIDGNEINSLYAVDNYGVLRFTGDEDNDIWEYVFTDDLQAKKVVVADSFNVWITSGKGLLSFNGTDLSTYDTLGIAGIDVVSLGYDKTIWSFSSIKKEIHGIRNNTSIYTESNTVKLQNIDKISAITSLDDKTTIFACQNQGILKLSYKKIR